MKTKVVYNACFGGFSLSPEAVRLGKALSKSDAWNDVDEKYGYIDEKLIPRHDPVLVKIVEDMGEDSSGSHANLKIEEIESPLYRIDEYDGTESVETPDTYNWVDVRKDAK